ncbi:MAG: hypothetical protein ABUS56_04800 [Acidobacteriota bacterium]
MNNSLPTARDLEEFRALRATIRERGTARVWLFVATMSVWGVLVLAVMAIEGLPALALVPLVVLASGFEAVFALHVGVERIGRYLQVFHADEWEHAAMAFGTPPRGTRLDPLFSAWFAVAAACNVVPVLGAGAVRAEWTALGAAHALFLVRVLVARRAAARQRAADLARFTQMQRG